MIEFKATDSWYRKAASSEDGIDSFEVRSIETQELDELEQCNKEFNEKMGKRPVTNLITCTTCNGAGGWISTMCDPPFTRCMTCKGEKYVDNTT